MSKSRNPLIHFSTLVVDRCVGCRFINKEHHFRPPFAQRYNDTMNQVRQTSAGTADTKEAQTNAEKAEEAWLNKHAWRLDTDPSRIEEKRRFSRFSHIVTAEGLLTTFMSVAGIETVCFIHVCFSIFGKFTQKKNGCHFPSSLKQT